MKKVLIRIFCLLMAFQVLFASVGFAMYEHLCKISGKSNYMLSQPKRTCCAKKAKLTEHSSKQLSFKRAKCCSDSVTHYKINPNASQGISIDYKIPSLAWIIEMPIFYTFTWVAQSVSFKIPHYYNTAPPLFGRLRLIFIQSFLI